MPDPLGARVRNLIRAYHGSPYDFDRFDASKIGTGEGAQSYGYGLYFAGSEDVAKGYRDRLKDTVENKISPELKQRLDDAWNGMLAHSRQRYEWLSSQPKGPQARAYPHQQEMDEVVARYYAAKSDAAAAMQNPGRVYEVEIGYPAHALLDWDKPLAKQNQRVRQVITEEDLVNAAVDGGTMGPDFSLDSPIGPVLAGHSSAAGGQASKSLFSRLFENDVPGIKYLDGFSRRRGEGTHNYVMFPGTEDQIRILRKYGMLAPVAAGAMQEE